MNNGTMKPWSNELAIITCCKPMINNTNANLVQNNVVC